MRIRRVYGARSEAVVSIPQELDAIEAHPALRRSHRFGALKSERRPRRDELVAIHGIGGLGHLAYSIPASRLQNHAISRGTDKRSYR